MKYYMDIKTCLLSVCVLSIYSVTATFIQELDLEEPGKTSPMLCTFGIPTFKCTFICLLQKSKPFCQISDFFESICLCRNANKQTETLPAETEKETLVQPSLIFYFITKIQPYSDVKETTTEKEGYIIETVNIQEDKLYYAFAYTLFGLFILIAYELIMCRHPESSEDQIIEDESPKLLKVDIRQENNVA